MYHAHNISSAGVTRALQIPVEGAIDMEIRYLQLHISIGDRSWSCAPRDNRIRRSF